MKDQGRSIELIVRYLDCGSLFRSYILGLYFEHFLGDTQKTFNQHIPSSGKVIEKYVNKVVSA